MNRLLQKVKIRVKGYQLLSKLSSSERALISDIRKKRLTYLADMKLYHIVEVCNDLKAQSKSGLFIEAGCALGGSAVLIAKQKPRNASLNVYDVFGMIPPPTAEDPEEVHERYRIISEGKSAGIKGDRYYGYEADLYERVKKTLEAFGIDQKRDHVELVKGLVQDTMEINEPVAFAHVDVDWYDPVKTCLERIFPHLIIGGSIILDDYHDWGGCRKATDEFLKTIEGQYELHDVHRTMRVTRVK
ncbi:MAG: TylF/MycF/NovP-related O-methyltransferase [Flavobacteriales bacterium]